MKKTGFFAVIIIFILLIPSFTLPETVKDVKIGVLSYRGKEEALRRWSPTAEYLSSKIHGYRFLIIPLGFNEIGPATRDRRIDFIITNTSIYVELEAAYGISRIATLKNRWKDQGYTVFGGVIFTRSDRKDINDLKDLAGKTFMAVDETSLGGWRMAWREMKKAGLNPYKDLKDLRFGRTHDGVVMAVLKREVDAGTVRTDVIERIADSGLIDIKDIKVLNVQRVEGFPFLLSTRLYPEWPFAKLRHVSEELSEKVALALLSMPGDGIASIISGSKGWTIPLDYQPVHDLMRELRVGPYRDYGRITFRSFMIQYWYVILLTLGIIIILTTSLLIILRLNKKLKDSELRIRHAMEGLDILVKERTSELEKKNKELQEEISKRINIEGLLNKEKRFTEQIFNSMPDFIAIINQDKKIIKANDALLKALKISEESLLKSPCYELICGQISDKRICPCDEMFKKGKETTAEIYSELFKKYFLVSATPLRDDSENIVAYIHVARDITERKLKEQQLMEAEEKFRSLVTESLIGIYIIQDGRFTYVNPEAARILGYTQEEIIGKLSPFDLATEECQEIIRENIRKRLDGEVKSLRDTAKIKRKDGELIDVEVLGSVILVNGRPAIIGGVIDITEKLRIEKEREAQRQFLQSILDSISDCVMVIRPDYRIEMINRPLKEKMKQDILCYKVSHGRDLPCEGKEHPCPIREIMEKRKPVTLIHKHLKHDGSDMIVEISASPVFDEKGEIIYIIESSRDITERVRLEEEHRRLIERLYLEEKEVSLITLTGGIAHDFNNILMAVMGSAELLRLKAREEDLPYIDNIIKSSEKMTELVRNLLAYTGQTIQRPSNININDPIKVALNLAQKGRFQNIVVRLDLYDDLWPVFADASLIQQMMINLIINAFEAIEDSDGSISIKTSNVTLTSPCECRLLNTLLPEGEYVKIEVSDTGQGIPKEIQNKVFEPFFTTKFIGRGLGLAAVAGIVKSHNGCISLESDGKKGTTFIIYLPRFIESEIERKARTGGEKRSQGILLVDDEETILNLIKEALSGMGYEVYPSKEGSEALEIFKKMKDEIGLAIIDIEMPGMDGRKLISELRSLSEDLKIIVSSGYDKETALRDIKSLANWFIQKPYRLSVLIEKIREVF